MKTIAVISGKGGTGKTTLTAAFASLVENVTVADCDVDAPDLHLILKPEIQETMEFHGLKVAVKDEKKCVECGQCRDHCRFGAIDDDITIHAESCEGCGVCEYICPTDAISLADRLSGYAYRSVTRFGPMAHATLNTAEEASGKLVTLVRNNARILAMNAGSDYQLIDGPPGIGCPVIASIAGVDLVVIVTEPTLSGIHDLERVAGVASHFGVPAVVCINKADINEKNTSRIELFARQNDIEVVGKLPYDDIVTDAMRAEKTINEFTDGEMTHRIVSMWDRITEVLT